MSLNTSNSKSVMNEINLTPLVDVMLVLLVVFIVTAPLLTPQDLNVNLPKTQSVTKTDAKNKVQLIIQADSQLMFDGRHIEVSDLVEKLKIISQDQKSQLQISADQTVPYGRVAEMMALAQANGVTKLSFLTQGGPSGAVRAPK